MHQYKSKLVAEGKLSDAFFNDLKKLVDMEDQAFQKVLLAWPPDTSTLTPDVRDQL